VSERYTHTVRGEEAGSRLDKFLGELDFLVSRSAGQKLVEGGNVLVNGHVASKHHITRAGEKIEVFMPPSVSSDLEPEQIPLDIRFEDEHMIVLNKPAGLVVHPAKGHYSGTLVHALLGHSASLGTLQGEDRPGIVHRLDKDTSGLMMVAKTDSAQAVLSDALRLRTIERRYVTLVHGYIAPDTGLVDAPLGRNPRDRMRMAVVDLPSSKQAVTTFRVMERYMAGRYDDGYTLAECKLYTGRTHQIRVHMTYIKHPVVGDPLYGRNHPKADLRLDRQFLHAYKLSFVHPVTGETLTFLDPLPQDLARRLRDLEPESMNRTEVGEELYPIIMPPK
jgi:23S rRNA pseudouridine1911/1915/1917 synthase